MREIQKGFLTGVAGCVEHTFALMEALKEAKKEHRQIVVTWIDLANAYGSVRHNLIQFALNWYNIPKLIQELIFDYYEKLMAKVITNNWSTGFFLFDIGLFQGCVLSTILFDCVFQLLLDFLRPHSKEWGYEFKFVKQIKHLEKAYADDLELCTRNPGNNQKACNMLVTWLDWSKTMKAKPKKCVSFGLKKYANALQRSKFEPILDRCYAPFDPKLKIKDTPINFILDSDTIHAERVKDIAKRSGLTDSMIDLIMGYAGMEKDFKSRHFKFLGRYIHYFLSESEIKKMIRKKFMGDMEIVNDTNINGVEKAWIYQHYVLSRLSWPFMIYDFDITFVKELNSLATSKLKKWLKLGRAANIGVLYRENSEFGVGLKSLIVHFKSMQLIKCQLLKTSLSSDIRDLYGARVEREKDMAGWTPTKMSAEAERDLWWDRQCITQVGRAGLGHGTFKAVLSKAEQRKELSKKITKNEQYKMIVHDHGLKRQGGYIQYQDAVMPPKLSWNQLLYEYSPYVVTFMFQSFINWVKTPDLLKIWGYVKCAKCQLCGGPTCTLQHILSGCRTALKDGRYTWRHDSILKCIDSYITEFLKDFNNSSKCKIPSIESSFVKEGAKPKLVPKTKKVKTSILKNARDWKILVDYDAGGMFPPEIISTTSRPDIVIWSLSTKHVIILELTCPIEENILDANARKRSKYTDLLNLIENQEPDKWTAEFFPIEVGARGLVAHSTRRCLSKLGMYGKTLSKLFRDVSQVAARCSFSIYISHKSLSWKKRNPILPK